MQPVDRFQERTLYNEHERKKVCDGVQTCSGESTNFSKFLQEAIELGKAKNVLSERELCNWYQNMQKDSSKQTVIDFTPVCKLLESFPDNASLPDVVSRCGDLLFSCSQLQALSDVKIEIESLILTHILARFSLPLIIFDTKEPLLAAQESSQLMKKFIANKVRERVFIHHDGLYIRCSTPSEENATDSYKNNRGEKISVEWHQLVRSADSW